MKSCGTVGKLNGNREHKAQPKFWKELIYSTGTSGGAVFSPDGQWLAYASNESGRFEVYLRPYPGPGGKTQISTEGGTQPVWARNGELFYRNGDKMMAVGIETEPEFGIGKPQPIFEGQYAQGGWARPNYDVAPDGQRFLMIKQEQTEGAQINVVLNWFEELKRLVPTP